MSQLTRLIGSSMAWQMEMLRVQENIKVMVVPGFSMDWHNYYILINCQSTPFPCKILISIVDT